MEINDIKSNEMQEIRDFCEFIDDYGHIYHYPPEKLNEPFKKILEGIIEVRDLINESWEM